jgi:hypothetical protein
VGSRIKQFAYGEKNRMTEYTTALIHGKDSTLPGEWNDVSKTDPGNFNHHWQRNPSGETPYPSIRLANEKVEPLAGLDLDGWTVEIYPYPESDEGHMHRTRHQTESDAVKQVVKYMLLYPHD